MMMPLVVFSRPASRNIRKSGTISAEAGQQLAEQDEEDEGHAPAENENG